MSLTSRELQLLAKEMPPSTSILSSGIARLFLSSPNLKVNLRFNPESVLISFPNLSEKKWTFTGIEGAVLLVVNRTRGAVLLQVFDLGEFGVKRFEVEVYYDMEYVSHNPQFHSFEIADCVAGLSFSGKDAARNFYKKVTSFIPNRPKDGRAAANPLLPAAMQISGVTNVTHKQHVGLTADGNIDLDKLSPEWKHIFKQAGVKKKEWKNPQTRRELIKSIALGGYSIESNPLAYQAAPAKKFTPPKQSLASAAARTPKSKVYTPQELNKHYTREQVNMYTVYRHQLQEYEKQKQRYEHDLAVWEAQERERRVESWEVDNEAFLQEEQKKKRDSRDARYTKPVPQLPPRKKGGPPKLPPRKSDLALPTIAEPDLPEPPHLPELPPLPNGDNPLESLQQQLMAVKLRTRPVSSATFLVPQGNFGTITVSPAPSTGNLLATAPPSDVLGLMTSALIARRAQLTDNDADSDSEDGWSD